MGSGSYASIISCSRISKIVIHFMMNRCQGQSGGVLLSTLHDYVSHGDPFVQSCVTSYLDNVSRPFYAMVIE